MKRTAAIAVFALPLIVSQPYYSPPGSGPETHLRLDNDTVRVIEYNYSPGDISGLHTHEFPRVVYALDTGTLELRSDSGDPVIVSLTAGQAIWRPRETHSVANVGGARIRVLETEIKR